MLPSQTQEPATNAAQTSASSTIALSWDLGMFTVNKHITTETYSFEAIKWVIETSTDPDTISEAVLMITDIGWLPPMELQRTIDQLTYHFFSAFDATGHLLKHFTYHGHVCFMAIIHLYWLRETYWIWYSKKRR